MYLRKNNYDGILHAYFSIHELKELLFILTSEQTSRTPVKGILRLLGTSRLPVPGPGLCILQTCSKILLFDFFSLSH